MWQANAFSGRAGSSTDNFGYFARHWHKASRTRYALAKALRVSTDGLLGLKALAPAAAEVEPHERRLWKKFRPVARLPEKDQRAVIRLINSVAAQDRKAG